MYSYVTVTIVLESIESEKGKKEQGDTSGVVKVDEEEVVPSAEPSSGDSMLEEQGDEEMKEGEEVEEMEEEGIILNALQM